MPKLDAVEIGNPCWADIMTSDPAATRAFYTELFGWDAEEPDEEDGGDQEDGEDQDGGRSVCDGETTTFWWTGGDPGRP